MWSPYHIMWDLSQKKDLNQVISMSWSKSPWPFLWDFPLWKRSDAKRGRVRKLLSGQVWAKYSFYRKNHPIMESHLKQDFPQRVVMVRACVWEGGDGGGRKISKATESWHTCFEVRLPVLVFCSVAQQDDRWGDECHTVSKCIRKDPSCHLFGRLQRCEHAPSTLPALFKLWAP